MKLRRLLAASAAVAVASAATVTSFATSFWGPTGNSNNSGLIACLKSDNGTATILEDTSLAHEVTKFVISVSAKDFEEASDFIADSWLGGAICLCSPSWGWAQKEFTFTADSAPVTFEADEDAELFVLTYDNGGTPIFPATDAYCQIHLHVWSDLGPDLGFQIADIKLLNADGVDVREAAAAGSDTSDEVVESVESADAVETEEVVESVETEEIVDETEEIVDETEETEDVVISDDDAWAAYDADAMAAMNEEFKLGVTDQIDIYALVGDEWENLAKVEGTFVWGTGFGGWCGGGGIGGGAVLADGSNWLSGPEYGAANANAGVEADGTATQTIIDITNNPMQNLVTYDAETGEFSFGKIFVQNWWNGVEAGAQLAAITAYDADGNVIGEITYDVETPENAVVEDTTDDSAVDTGAATDDNKGGSPDTGVEGVAAAAGLVALAGVAVAISRKRK